MPTGIRKRGNSWEASLWDARSGKQISRTFPTLAAARSWRADALVAVRQGAMKPSQRMTVREASERLLGGMRDGTIQTRAGDRYRVTTIEQAERSLRLHVLPAFGNVRVDRLEPRDLRAFAESMAANHKPGTVLSAMQPLRLILKRAVLDGQLAVSPARALGLPGGKRRENVVTDTALAARLIAALEPTERVIFATAFYAGLRRGELRALRNRHIDLAGGSILVRESVSCDQREPGELKTTSGRRDVPIIALLRAHLAAQRPGAPDAFVFGGRDVPFTPGTIRRRAVASWKRAGLEPIALQSARHTFASIMIAAGLDAKQLSVYMGHASIATTYDVYGWLMAGSADSAVSRMDAYLARADTASRLTKLS
jgi:integrase